ncbi:MAG: hypothetical protein C5T88_00630 [Williamsoniiplasma luminosum]|uniref:Choline kinase n=2 Tax=Williamsoniiplasma luminosum TaxID=214888 RepID=A0A2S0NJA7_9MOLU|nr:MAG: hypothetical protein C5T88_00630 [Williamsoniiplasma luminosum]
MRIIFISNPGNLSFTLTPNKIEHKGRRWVSKMRYYPNSKTLSIKKLKLDRMKIILSLINELHQQKYDLKVFDPREFLDLFISKVGLIEELNHWTPKINLILQNYYDGTPPVLSHNDLVPENFLIKEHQIFLIDFEYVSYNHYLYDYASFTNELYPMAKKREFIKLLNLNHQELIKLNQLMQYQTYLWAHWAKYMYQASRERKYLKLMKEKIEQLG